jgi:HK97 family phage prohead protease
MTKKSDLERRFTVGSIELRAKDGDEESRTLEGFAAMYEKDSHDLGGFVERIAPGAFKRAFDGQHDVFALADHDHAKRLARQGNGSLRMFDDPKGLRVEIDLPDTTTGRDMLEEVRSGLVAGMSFGFRVKKDTWEEPDDEAAPYLRTLEDVELFEVSAVGRPAYPDTTIAARGLEVARAQNDERKGLSAEETRELAKKRLRLAGA